jgi:hypothetical protein
MQQILNLEQFNNIFIDSGISLLFLHSPSCHHCIDAEVVIEESKITLGALVDNVYKCESSICRDYCEENEIFGTPSLILLNNSQQVSKMDFAPTQSLFLEWLINSLL